MRFPIIDYYDWIPSFTYYTKRLLAIARKHGRNSRDQFRFGIYILIFSTGHYTLHKRSISLFLFTIIITPTVRTIHGTDIWLKKSLRGQSYKRWISHMCRCHISSFHRILSFDFVLVGKLRSCSSDFRSAEELLETAVTVGLVVLLLEGALVQLFQAKRADEVFGVEFAEHRGYAATCEIEFNIY